MPKRKTVEEAPGKTEPAPDLEVKSRVPGKQGSPGQIMRAEQELATPEAGASGRARSMEAMQQSVGNKRAGQLMAKPAPGADVPGIQRAKKGQDPKKPPPITLPLPKEATRNATGEAEFRAGPVRVVALPDKKRSKPIIVNGKKRDALTHVSLHWDLPGANHQGDKVISVDPVPAPTLAIQTTYGPKAGPETKSGYGKGTTPEDIKAGKTSLGYHEGSHGEYAIQFTKDHPLPAFKGTVGMSVEEYIEAQTEYDQEMEAYRQALDEYHKIMTDCVGQKGEGCEK